MAIGETDPPRRSGRTIAGVAAIVALGAATVLAGSRLVQDQHRKAPAGVRGAGTAISTSTTEDWEDPATAQGEPPVGVAVVAEIAGASVSYWKASPAEMGADPDLPEWTATFEVGDDRLSKMVVSTGVAIDRSVLGKRDLAQTYLPGAMTTDVPGADVAFERNLPDRQALAVEANGRVMVLSVDAEVGDDVDLVDIAVASIRRGVLGGP